jgi:prolyl-tRNA synthetase
MHDRKALQAGTSHYFGDGFARQFDITFTDKDNTLKHPHQTSWGFATRSIGGIIMTHGDNNGLILPPRVAPIQAIIIPVAAQKPGVLDKARELASCLKEAGVRVKCDESDRSPGWKFAEHEMKGVPLRVEIGPKDIETAQCVAARRDTGEKIFIPLSEVEARIPALLDEIQNNLYAKAKENLTTNTRKASTMDEIKAILGEHGGFVSTMWCGSQECELKMKEEADVTSRCVPFEQEKVGDTCPICNGAGKKNIIWGVSY